VIVIFSFFFTCSPFFSSEDFGSVTFFLAISPFYFGIMSCHNGLAGWLHLVCLVRLSLVVCMEP
jgi:hypothetical protein